MHTWLSNLSNGVLASIIASIIMLLITGFIVTTKIVRRSRLKITRSIIKGDVVGGDKRRASSQHKGSLVDKRDTTTIVKKTTVEGDVVQGDKEI